MSDEILQDDQSHYEISLTAGQAFVAFVLLLLSLSASFAFGLMIGKGQADSRLVVQREPSIVTEASALGKPQAGEIVELVPDRAAPQTDSAATATEETTSTAPVVVEETATTDSAAAPAPATDGSVSAAAPSPVAAEPKPAAPDTRPAAAAEPRNATPSVPYYAQLLSTGDQKTAETLAARLIDNGFTSAYVERGTNARGQVFRVRVKFGSEPEARAAEARLKTFSKDVWITK